MKSKNLNCKYCNSEMEAKTKRKLFCSDYCRVCWNREFTKVLIDGSAKLLKQLDERDKDIVKVINDDYLTQRGPKPVVANLTPDQSKEVLESATNGSKWIRREVPKPPPGLTAIQQIMWKKEHGVK